MQFRVCTLPLFFVLPVVLPSPAAAQVHENEPPPAAQTPGFCWTARPKSDCRAFLVAGTGYQWRQSGSEFVQDNGRGVFAHPELRKHWQWQLGAMTNTGTHDAWGAVLLLGTATDGARLGAEARYRRWLGRHAALDLGAGVLRAEVDAPCRPPVCPHRIPGAGVTGEASLGLTDWVALAVRAETVWTERNRPYAVYAGVRLGTIPGLVATGGVLAFLMGMGNS